MAVRETLARAPEALTDRRRRCSSRWAAAAPTSRSCARASPSTPAPTRSGSIRMRQNLASWHGSHEQRMRLLRRHIHNVVEDIRREMPLREAQALHRPRRRRALRGRADRWASEPRRGRARRRPRRLPRASATQIVGLRRRAARRAYRLPQAEAETLVPALLAYRELLLETPAEERARARRLAARRAPPRPRPRPTRAAGHRGLPQAGAGQRRRARREVPLRRAPRPQRGRTWPRASSTSCAPSTGSATATACCSRWRPSSTTSATT